MNPDLGLKIKHAVIKGLFAAKNDITVSSIQEEDSLERFSLESYYNDLRFNKRVDELSSYLFTLIERSFNTEADK